MSQIIIDATVQDTEAAVLIMNTRPFILRIEFIFSSSFPFSFVIVINCENP